MEQFGVKKAASSHVLNVHQALGGNPISDRDVIEKAVLVLSQT